MNYGVLPKLTRDYILNNISPEQIMEKYLGIIVDITIRYIAPNIIRSNDNNPTCSFYYNEHGRLRFKDFGGTFNGDCFDVAGKAINVDCNNKRDFILILHTIAKDFRIHKYVDHNEVINYNKNVSNFLQKKKKFKTKAIFKIIPRNYNYHDFDYWNKFNINQQLLNIGKVYAAQEIYILKNEYYTKIYSYSTKDPAYCYFGSKDENLVDNWKIYYPYRKKGEVRFHSNSSFLQGKHLITSDRIGIITKAYKDVLSFKSFGIQAVAPSAESVLLTKDDYFFMKSKFNYLISCMDYDPAGIRMMRKLWKHYRIQPIMFTNGTNNSKNFHVKDFAEYVDKYGNVETTKLIASLFNKQKHQMYHDDTTIYNYLKHTL